jgi:hypothetical protein
MVSSIWRSLLIYPAILPKYFTALHPDLNLTLGILFPFYGKTHFPNTKAPSC